MNADFSLARDRAALLALADEWDALWTRSHGDYHLGFPSCLTSWDVIHAPRGRRLCCAILRMDGALRAVLPMVTFRRKLWRFATTLGPEAAEGCDLLQAEGGSRDEAAALLAFFMRRVRPDAVDLPYVRAGSALDQAIGTVTCRRRVTQTDVIPYASLGGEDDWEDYERSLGRSAQQQTGRKHRRMAEAGATAFEVRTGEADAAIDWLLDEKARWGLKVDKIGSWLFSTAYRTWLKRYAATDGRVLTFVLTFDGRPAAVKVIVVGPRLCTLIIAAYDETLSRFSPGNILDGFWIRHVFDHARDADGRRVDITFGVGVERYKMHWGRGLTQAATTYKLIGTRWGTLPYIVKDGLQAVRGGLRRLEGSLMRTGAPAASSDP